LCVKAKAITRSGLAALPGLGQADEVGCGASVKEQVLGKSVYVYE
jgi:hypothetical protein